MNTEEEGSQYEAINADDSEDETVKSLPTSAVHPQEILREIEILDENKRKIKIELGDCVELKTEYFFDQSQGRDFLKVTKILKDVAGNYLLQGLRLRRARRLEGMIDNKKHDLLNELVVIIQMTGNADPARILHEGQITVQSSQIFRKRRLIITNYAFPDFSFWNNPCYLKYDSRDDMSKDQRQSIASDDQVVCRWLYIQFYESHANRQQGKKAIETIIRQFTSNEICQFTKVGTEPKCASERIMMHSWIGDLKFNDPLTFADGFCGAGGVSQAAEAAGLITGWACDNCDYAKKTYRLNFPRVDFFPVDIDILRMLNDDLRVDILHLSIVCKFASPANTQAGRKDHRTPGGQQDETNSALFTVIKMLLHKVRPRAVTLEETFGLESMERNKPWFREMISHFTELGYSLRWKIVDFADFGSCQHRKRLIIFASCPGAGLPSFPRKTHGPGTGRPYNTIRHAISGIADNDPDHNVNFFRERRISRPDPDGQLRRIVTCKGTEDCHPDGWYSFTIRQLANIQGLRTIFPPGIPDTIKKILIGNAVPPFQMFLEEVKRTILAQDRRFLLEIAATPPRPSRRARLS